MRLAGTAKLWYS